MTELIKCECGQLLKVKNIVVTNFETDYKVVITKTVEACPVCIAKAKYLAVENLAKELGVTEEEIEYSDIDGEPDFPSEKPLNDFAKSIKEKKDG